MNAYKYIDDFHGARKTGVGSSDIPVLAGLVKQYGRTSLKLWQEKKGLVEGFQGNERTRVGNDLESYVLARFLEERNGVKIEDFMTRAILGKSYGGLKLKTEARHPEHPFCLAHADLLFHYPSLKDEEAFIVEAKTVGAFASKRREGEIFTGYDLEDRSAQGIPDAVYLQVQWQLFCYGVKTAYVAALIDNQFGIWGPIEANSKVQASCLALAQRFWRLVEADEMPSPENWDDLEIIWPNRKNETSIVVGDQEQKTKAMIARYRELKAKIKSHEGELDDIKTAIGVLIGENSVLANSDGDILAKCSDQSRESVSLGDLKKSAPEILEQIKELGLVKSTKFRKLSIKGEE